MPTPQSNNLTAPPEVDVRAALAQQFMSDRLFGVESVPVPVGALAGMAAPGAGASAVRPRSAASGDPEAGARLRVLDEREVQTCRKCSLSKTRTKTVFGCGSPQARLVFVGEAPGFDEDRTGMPFVGKAGALLTKMIEAGMGLARDEVYICNVLKCRPPSNRDPSADEILACSAYLQQQLEWIHPEVIIALGAPAAKTLLCTTSGIGKLRGRFHEYDLSGTKGAGPVVSLMPTYHPAYLLRNPGEKGKTWSDLQMVMAKLGLPISKK